MFGSEEGQGLVEYALILVLVVIVVIAILLLLGPVVGNVPVDSISSGSGGPYARNDLIETAVDTPKRYYVLENDSPYSYLGRTEPISSSSPTVPDMTEQGGTLSKDSSRYVVYEPAPGFVGHDSFIYSIYSGGYTDEAEVTIAVGEIPVARPDKRCAISLTPLDIDLLENDTGGAYPIVPSTLTVWPIGIAADRVEAGIISLDINDEGILTYTYTLGVSLGGLGTMEAEFLYTFLNTLGERSNEGRVTIKTQDRPCQETLEAGKLSDMAATDQTSEDTLAADDLTHEAAEQLAILADQVSEQDALFAETMDLGQSALDAFIDVFLADAINSGDDSLVQKIITLQQELEAGNFDYLLTALPELTDDINAVPAEVKSTIILSVEPMLVDSCLTLSAARVPPESFYAAGNALSRVEADDPGRTGEAISQFLEARDQVEARRQFIDEFNPFLAHAIDIGVTTLLEQGDEALIAQALAFKDMSRPCATGWDELEQAIATALINKEGIRQSLFDQADEAKAAYELGFYKASGETLNAMINHINAQEGKSIDPESAETLRDTIGDLAIGLNIPLRS